MGILPLKKCVNRVKCSFTTKQRMFGVFAIDEILCYRWTRFAGSRTLCHPALQYSAVALMLKRKRIANGVINKNFPILYRLVAFFLVWSVGWLLVRFLSSRLAGKSSCAPTSTVSQLCSEISFGLIDFTISEIRFIADLGFDIVGKWYHDIILLDWLYSWWSKLHCRSWCVDIGNYSKGWFKKRNSELLHFWDI